MDCLFWIVIKYLEILAISGHSLLKGFPIKRNRRLLTNNIHKHIGLGRTRYARIFITTSVRK